MIRARAAAGLPAALLSGLLAAGAPALAHGGRTDAAGCHIERATGQRHCHGARPVPRETRGEAPPDFAKLLEEQQRAAPFANCAAARAAGAAPLRRGDPRYAPRLDRDGDGVACE